jgi:hypothetical protein
MLGPRRKVAVIKTKPHINEKEWVVDAGMMIS